VHALEDSDRLWTAGAARFVDVHDRVISVWRAAPPVRRRVWWLLGPWGVPQAATFWRREAFDRHGLFREDMHYVFDTEFGLRLAFAGELPVLIERELAVRVEHEDAKSWDLQPFEREQRRFLDLYRDRLTRTERASLQTARALRRVGFFRVTGAASRAYRRVRPLPN
jgi:GT2 family glycosyltransferase